MLFNLDIVSIHPTTVANTGTESMSVYFILSGDGLVLPGVTLSLYSSSTGGSLVKVLYNDNLRTNLNSGEPLAVSFSGVEPGTYYVELQYKARGTPRKAVTVTGQSSGGSTDVRNLKLNGTTITSNKLNGSNVSNETLNGNKVYE